MELVAHRLDVGLPTAVPMASSRSNRWAKEACISGAWSANQLRTVPGTSPNNGRGSPGGVGPLGRDNAAAMVPQGTCTRGLRPEHQQQLAGHAQQVDGNQADRRCHSIGLLLG